MAAFFSPLLLALLVALTVLPSPSVRGASLELNPITPLGDRAALNHRHPAFGGPIDPSNKIEPLVFQESREKSHLASNATLANLRRLETSNRDIKRLEAYFDMPLERNFYVLRDKYSRGAAPVTPWPSSYWPAYKDGINYAWRDDEPSPSEKYARAYNKNVKQVQDAISKSTGVLAESNNKPCKKNSDCRSLNNGSKCGIRAGERSGFCIPTWYGICHAWSTGAILEPEPKCSVKKNGVLFRPLDIKALISQVYDSADVDVLFLCSRYSGSDYPEYTDEYGRYEDPTRRDCGPGLFHLAVTNIMARYKKSFVIDIASNSEVWNQPAREFQVKRMELVDIKTASRKAFGTDYYPFNDAVKYLAYTELALSWIDESNEDGELVATGRVDKSTYTNSYYYFLELDANHDIIGGEWLYESRYDHIDFAWIPVSKPAPDATAPGGISYGEVSDLLARSRKCT